MLEMFNQPLRADFHKPTKHFIHVNPCKLKGFIYEKIHESSTALLSPKSINERAKYLVTICGGQLMGMMKT